uniref:Uncharacterized protein n=3 Tax=Timema TaxID=61471 RepID=A0A7R9AU99_TIMSH|nr:unnamed protein product [Timema douglasi]CAD7260729.1 unnamed protein product [Timema shepardi]CAD7403219.1 unnamed protein product [Timema poppensis]
MKVITEESIVNYDEETVTRKDKINQSPDMRLKESRPDSTIERLKESSYPMRHKLTDVSEVEDCLLICSASAVRPDRFPELGVTCLVNAAAELPDPPLPKGHVISYIKVAINDRPSVDLNEHLHSVADIIEKVRRQGGHTLVHCVAGISRSAALCLAYLVKHKQMPLRKAFSYLRTCRPCIRPNSGFFNQLIEFEREVLGTTSVSMVHNQAAGTFIPDVYEPEYQNMLWYQQHYNRNFGRH